MSQIKKADGFVDWLDQRLAIKKLFKVLLTEYWMPKNMNMLWAMGIILVVMFSVLVISGIFLLMYYKPDTKLAFDSVNNVIMQQVHYGWLFRHVHAVAASVIFLIIYIHMFTGIYYGSYKKGREIIWITGVVLYSIFSAEAFSGYMLPWGQMSYWAASVITNIFGGIPFIGHDLVIWIRGGFSVGDPTLTRFFMLHVLLLPLIIILVIVIHFYSLRFPHVNNYKCEDLDYDAEVKEYKEGDRKKSKIIPFWPAMLSKEFVVICLFMALFSFLVFYNYDFAMDPINFDPANNLQTPHHIYPEWYFLWSYEILRGFFFDVGPLKAASIGLIFFALANIIMYFLPALDRSPLLTPAGKRSRFRIWYWILLFDMIGLTILGKLPPEGNFIYLGFVFSLLFVLLWIALPFISRREKELK